MRQRARRTAFAMLTLLAAALLPACDDGSLNIGGAFQSFPTTYDTRLRYSNTDAALPVHLWVEPDTIGLENRVPPQGTRAERKRRTWETEQDTETFIFHAGRNGQDLVQPVTRTISGAQAASMGFIGYNVTWDGTTLRAEPTDR
jgi:hypothetical protein